MCWQFDPMKVQLPTHCPTFTVTLYNAPPPFSPVCRALWSRDECRTMCWQLDPTEGPGRVRRRMMRAPLTIHSRHILTNSATRRSEGEEKEGAQHTHKSQLMFLLPPYLSVTLFTSMYLVLLTLRSLYISHSVRLCTHKKGVTHRGIHVVWTYCICDT